MTKTDELALERKIEKLQSEKAELINALDMLVKVKNHKEDKGKDDWYKIYQPKAWEQARDLIARLEEK